MVIMPHREPLEHPATPQRSPDQRIGALMIANEIRTLRGQLKRERKAGRVFIVALLLDPPAWPQTAKVSDMLLALPKSEESRPPRFWTAAGSRPARPSAA